jgi:multidrug efflux system membrane fusion protein
VVEPTKRGAARLSYVPLLLSALACSSAPVGPEGRGAQRPAGFPVEVRPAEARTVDYKVSAVGSVEAFETVQVVARVPGAVDRVLFAEGDAVEQDRVLVEIEPARYRVEVESARALLERARAELEDARATLERRERSPGLFPLEDVETHRTRVLVAEANVAAQAASAARAELNLREALVRAPVSGVVETRSVVTGQYAQAGSVLATLVRREPLLLRFEVPAPDAAPLVAGLEVAFEVHGDEESHRATITHVAGYADPASRMVAVTARVTSSARGTLRPGAFADVSVPVGRASGVPVIPETAIRPSERGFLAFVVEGETAHERVLELGLRTADGLVEVRSGLVPGELLVVRGAEALGDGAAVRIEGAGGGGVTDAGNAP